MQKRIIYLAIVGIISSFNSFAQDNTNRVNGQERNQHPEAQKQSQQGAPSMPPPPIQGQAGQQGQNQQPPHPMPQQQGQAGQQGQNQQPQAPRTLR